MTELRSPRGAQEFRSSRVRTLLVLGVLAPLAGLGVGVIGALFRLTLEGATRFRDEFIRWTGQFGAEGIMFTAVAAIIAMAVAAWLVRVAAPSAAGSGIPRVMAVLDGNESPAPPAVIPIKFLAGTLAIGTGLAVGREGPSVQIGASLAYHTGRLFRQNSVDCLMLLAAGAAAGFATAFNAPIAGAIFAAEALVKRFEAKMMVCALAASAAAIIVSRLILGDGQDFSLPHLSAPTYQQMPLYLLLGVGAGLAGVAYNRTVLSVTALVNRLTSISPEMRAATIGLVVGSVAWFAPGFVGSGDAMAQQALNGAECLPAIPFLWLLRLALISVSVAAGTPGGLLVPFLSLGAELGLFFGGIYALAFPGLAIEPSSFAFVGMAALFTAIIRAPMTAIVLLTEMTADATLLLPMVISCFAAMLVPTLMNDVPILDALKNRGWPGVTIRTAQLAPRSEG